MKYLWEFPSLQAWKLWEVSTNYAQSLTEIQTLFWFASQTFSNAESSCAALIFENIICLFIHQFYCILIDKVLICLNK